jgi:hypothetical protein
MLLQQHTKLLIFPVFSYNITSSVVLQYIDVNLFLVAGWTAGSFSIAVAICKLCAAVLGNFRNGAKVYQKQSHFGNVRDLQGRSRFANREGLSIACNSFRADLKYTYICRV